MHTCHYDDIMCTCTNLQVLSLPVIMLPGLWLSSESMVTRRDSRLVLHAKQARAQSINLLSATAQQQRTVASLTVILLTIPTATATACNT